MLRVRRRVETVSDRSNTGGKRRQARGPSPSQVGALRQALKARLEEVPNRWNASPEEVRQSVVKLVLTLAEFLRELLERQAIRRMEEGSLEPEQIEAVGLALMRLEQTLQDLARQFDLTPEDLNLDLGPLGRLR